MLRALRVTALGIAAAIAATMTSIAPAEAAPTLAARQCTAAYVVAAQWPTGFVAHVIVANTGVEPIDGWTVVIIYPDAFTTVTSAWNSTYTQISNVVIIRSVGWNRHLPPNGSTVAGFVAAGTNSAPSSVTCIPD